MPSFSRIVRFKARSGKTLYGEIPGDDLVTKETLQGQKVEVYQGDTPFDESFTLTERTEEIVEV